MLQFTVLIKLTGLLLLAPNTHDGKLPLHVLAPVPGSQVQMPHVPEVGVVIPKPECKIGGDIWYDDTAGVCYVNMDGWFMEIGTPEHAPTSVVLPFATTNLSTALNRFINPAFFGETPDATKLRSRVTINGGIPSESCELYKFNVLNPDGSGTLLTSPLTNVLDWEIQNVQGSQLVLVRRPLNPGPGHDKPEPVFWITPQAGHVQVVIRQVTDDERKHQPTTHQSPPFRNTHFHAYYDLLGISTTGRHLPDLVEDGKDSQCIWPGDPAAGPSTPTCMIAGGLPPP